MLRQAKKAFTAEEELKSEWEKFCLGQGNIIFMEKVFVDPPHDFIHYLIFFF